MKAHDFPDRYDDDQNISEDVWDLETVVERNDRNASSLHLRVPELLHGHAEEESGQDNASAPDGNDGDEDVDLPVKIPRVVREQSAVLHQDR